MWHVDQVGNFFTSIAAPCQQERERERAPEAKSSQSEDKQKPHFYTNLSQEEIKSRLARLYY